MEMHPRVKGAEQLAQFGGKPVILVGTVMSTASDSAQICAADGSTVSRKICLRNDIIPY